MLIETPEGNLSQIMQHINGAYTTYFNVKRHRSGHLLQGRYKSILVEADAYALELSRYMHLNPVRAGMVARPEEYEWSSYLFYALEEEKPEWLFTDFILGYYDDRYSVAHHRYRGFVESLIGKEYRSPLSDALRSTILGTLDFVSGIKGRLQTDEIHLCHRYTSARLREIGAHFGIGESAVNQNSRRFTERPRAHAEITSHSWRRCIPPGCVEKTRNMPDIPAFPRLASWAPQRHSSVNLFLREP